MINIYASGIINDGQLDMTEEPPTFWQPPEETVVDIEVSGPPLSRFINFTDSHIDVSSLQTKARNARHSSVQDIPMW
jgi:hypothetical protein